jgi:hypothetical protein
MNTHALPMIKDLGSITSRTLDGNVVGSLEMSVRTKDTSGTDRAVPSLTNTIS